MPSPPQLGGEPLPMYLNFTEQQGIFWPVSPSHLPEPMSQPLLNQKQAWPLLPVMFRGSSTDDEGFAHQFGLSNGIGYLGTLPFQGAILPSMACLGGGPC